MPRFLATLVRFKRDKRGVSAVEYGLLIAFVATAIFVSVQTLGTSLNTKLTSFANQWSSVTAK